VERRTAEHRPITGSCGRRRRGRRPSGARLVPWPSEGREAARRLSGGQATDRSGKQLHGGWRVGAGAGGGQAEDDTWVAGSSAHV
jgi:hypothetical protein